YRGMTVHKVAGRAGASPRTFYELFSDREDCFLAAFDHAVGELTGVVGAAFEGQRDWVAGVRAGLSVLLGALDWEPALRRLVFVESLVAGPRALARRAGGLEQLAGVIDEGRRAMKRPRGLPSLTAEGVVGGAFSVIHARLCQEHPEPLIDLLGPLIAMIVLPYRGSRAATRELNRPVSEAGPDTVPTLPAEGLD